MPFRKAGALLVLPLVLGACGSSAKLQSAKTNPALRADEAKAQAIVQSCVQRSHLSRKKFVACVAPPGQKAQMQACASKAFAKNGVLTKRQRQRLESGLTACVLKVRR